MLLPSSKWVLSLWENVCCNHFFGKNVQTLFSFLTSWALTLSNINGVFTYQNSKQWNRPNFTDFLRNIMRNISANWYYRFSAKHAHFWKFGLLGATRAPVTLILNWPRDNLSFFCRTGRGLCNGFYCLLLSCVVPEIIGSCPCPLCRLQVGPELFQCAGLRWYVFGFKETFWNCGFSRTATINR